MPEQSQADQWLIDEIRNGSSEGWSQLVDRYQGRLTAFARSRIKNSADIDDVVQETLLSFLKNLHAYRGEASLESYLFTILRRKIVDLFRGRPVPVCSIQDGSNRSDEDAPAAALTPTDNAASWYARKNENMDELHTTLTTALNSLINEWKDDLDFESIQLAEMVFYAQLGNQDISRRMQISENQVAVTKHRILKKIAQKIREIKSLGESETGNDQDVEELISRADLLTQVWEEQRPSCLKRSTIGQYLLETLDEEWHDYADFHVKELGCRFCQANLDDLKEKSEDTETQRLHEQIMQSSIGFFKVQ